MDFFSQIFENLQSTQSLELLIVSDDKQARHAQDVAHYLGFRTYLFPDIRANFGDDLRSYQEEFFEFVTTLKNYYHDKKTQKIAIVPLRTLLYKFPKPELLETISIEFASRYDISSLKEQLFYSGYNFVDLVEQKGEVSFRGDIVDIYPPDCGPYRISFFDDECESIRQFELETQKSKTEEFESIQIMPALFRLDNREFEELQAKVQELHSDSFSKDIHSLGYWVLEQSEYFYTDKKAYFAHDMQDEIAEIKEFYLHVASTIFSLPTFFEAKKFKDITPVDLDSLLEFHQDKKITVVAKSEEICKRRIQVPIHYHFKQSSSVFHILSKDELIVSLNTREVTKKRRKATLILDELKIGDYVVHKDHGIGIFSAIEQREVMGAKSDFVVLSYQGDDKLLIPASNLQSIDRYIASSGSVAQIDRLGKGSFAKIKQKAKEKLFEIAAHIVATAASRELTKAQKIRTELTPLQRFQQQAGFEYTQDQTKAINEIMQDLSLQKPMDRLLSGDVGFGKTEVAMNALFAVVVSGFQGLLIAPTTLLSSQHFKSLQQRMKPFDIKVARYDRFTSSKDKRLIEQKAMSGEIDIVVGTHALFRLKMKNLALAVVDEEHKFGVKQKEQLKEYLNSLHILSMSATPIPRSLNQALSSIKGYSTLLTPPSEKEEVRTFVKEYDEKLVKEIIQRELRRGGQVFYVHNTIASLEEKKKALLEILPQLRVLILHSKVSSNFMEDEMKKFEENEYDVLLSTSIVESGIHLPNVNTMIIDGSERFGMADLHQLRGRVGRGKKSGFCYFLVEDKRSLTPEATKRLLALETNSFLGSGSILAYHDLEIRGGGNLVGEAQSGHIKNIGYSLYLKMLEDALNELLGKSIQETQECEVKLSVSAYISEELVCEDRLRLELYRRLSRCEDVVSIVQIEEEIVDRFGKLDIVTKQFLDIITIKTLAIKNSIKLVSNYQQNITFTFIDDTKESITSKSRDDDDILDAVLVYLRKRVS